MSGGQAQTFTCPVCGYPSLGEPHVDPMGSPTYSICPCCGIEFGYDDAQKSHAELRREWVSRGSPWWSKHEKPPPGWSAEDQLRAAGMLRAVVN
jgi:hypothetical protein